MLLPTTAMQTFRDVQRDEATFSHANQVKSIVAQLMTAVGISLATLMLQWRSSVRYTQLAESLSAGNFALAPTLEALAGPLAGSQGGDVGSRRALALLSQMVSQEAVFMGALDFFALVAALAAAGALVAVAIGTFRRFASAAASR